MPPSDAAETVAAGAPVVSPQLQSHYRANRSALTRRQPHIAERIADAPWPTGCVEAVGRDGSLTFRIPYEGDDCGVSGVGAGRDARPTKDCPTGRDARPTEDCPTGGDARATVEGAAGGDDARTTETRYRWLGGTSMPSVSAPAILEGAVGDGSNLVLPGVQSGWEPAVLLDRTWPHVAVFVLESDPSLAKLALHVRDFAEWIDSGRLVLLLGADPVAELESFLEAHPGYVFPTKLIRLPQCSPHDTARTQAALEAVGARAAEGYQRRVEQLAARIRQRGRVRPVGARPGDGSALTMAADRAGDSPARTGVRPEDGSALAEDGSVEGPALTGPRVALLGVDPNPRSIEYVRRIERGLVHLGWPFETCVPDRPERCHVSARLAAIERIEADFVLLIDAPPGAMSGYLPADLPTATWIMPGGRVDPAAVRAGGDAHFYFCADVSARDALIAAGIDESRVAHVDVGADYGEAGGALEDGRPRRLKPAARGDGIAVFADLPDARPQACGLTMTSHVKLFEAIRGAMSRRLAPIRGRVGPDVDRFGAANAESLLTQVMRSTGIRIKDDVLRGQFLSAIVNRLYPRLMGEAVARACIESGRPVGLWGADWSAFRASGIWRAAMPVTGTAEAVPAEFGTAIFPLPAFFRPRGGDGDGQRRPPHGGRPRHSAVPGTEARLADCGATTCPPGLMLDLVLRGAWVVVHGNAGSFRHARPELHDVAEHLCFAATLEALRGAPVGRTCVPDDRFEAIHLIGARHMMAHRLDSIWQTVRPRRAH